MLEPRLGFDSYTSEGDFYRDKSPEQQRIDEQRDFAFGGGLLKGITELPLDILEFLSPEDEYNPGALAPDQSSPRQRIRTERLHGEQFYDELKQDPITKQAAEVGYGASMVVDPVLDTGLLMAPHLLKGLNAIRKGEKPAITFADIMADEVGAIGDLSKPEGSLIAQHNLSAANLAHAEKMGGIPVPSLAINKADEPLMGFGEISLIADKSMIDPKGPNKTKVFGADVYSPRYPSVDFKTSRKGEERLKERLAVYEEEIGANWSDYPDIADRGRDAIENSGLAMADFLTEIGEKIPKVREVNLQGKTTKKIDDYKTKNKMRSKIEKKFGGEFQLYIDDIMDDVVDEERLFQGYTYSGQRRYKAHTLDNVTKQMKKDLRGGEGFNYGPGSLRAQFTPQFKSIKQIKGEEGRLVSKESFNDMKTEISDDMFALYEDMKPHMKHQSDNQFMNYDQFQEQIGEVSTKGVRGVMNEYFPDAPDSAGVANFISKLSDYPTEYFEANILRSVGIDEFSAAVVPTGTSKKVIDSLKKKGLKVMKYKAGDNDARKATIGALKNLRFSVLPASMIAQDKLSDN